MFKRIIWLILCAFFVLFPSNGNEMDRYVNDFWKSFPEYLSKSNSDCQQALIIAESNKNEASKAFFIMAEQLEFQTKYDSAFIFYKKAIQSNPSEFLYTLCLFKLGQASAGTGNMKLAIQFYHQALANLEKGKHEKGDQNWYFKPNFRRYGYVQPIFLKANPPKYLTQKDTAFLKQIILYYLADGYKRTGNLDSAIFYYEQNRLFSEIHNDIANQTYSMLDIAFCYRLKNQTQKAAKCLFEALQFAEEMKDQKLIASCLWQIGESFAENKYSIDDALEYYNKALALCKDKDFDYLRIMIENKISCINIERNQVSAALLMLNQCMSTAQNQHLRHQMSRTNGSLGLAYKKLGNYKESLNCFISCYENGCDLCPKIAFHYALIEAGDLCFTIGDGPHAKQYFQQSLELAQKSGAIKEQALSEFKLACYFVKISDHSQAEFFLKKSYALAGITGNLALQKSISECAASFFEKNGNYKSALMYSNKARSLSDSLFQQEKNASLEALALNYEFEKLKREKESRELLNAREIRSQKMRLLALLVISLLSIGFGLVIYRSLKRKRAANILLQQQKDQILQSNCEIRQQLYQIAFQKEEIEKISEQLKEAEQLRTRFFTNISHELKTPLTLIVSPLLRLLEKDRSAENLELYQLMLRNARKLQEMIQELLDISRQEKGKLQLNLECSNLNQQLAVHTSMFQSLAEEKNIQLSFVNYSKELCFYYDPLRVEQIMNNLLSNAFKFTPEGGSISVEISCLEKYAQMECQEFAKIVVRDSGIGIVYENKDKVFERFFRVKDSSAMAQEGSGIGLSFTRDLVELHGGSISLESMPHKGSEFVVLLPMKRKLDVSNEELPQVENEITFLETNEINSAKTKNILLLVEDNAELRNFLNGSLSKYYQVVLACDGAEGIEKAKKVMPDIIISDVMMPYKDGFELTSELKNFVGTCHIPIILLTAKSAYESKINGLQKGADDYIAKPFDEKELLLKINNFLQNRAKLQDKYKQQFLSESIPADVPKSMEEQFLQKVTQFIEKEISNSNLDVELICSELGLSKSQLYRKITAITGLSINHYIRKIRLQKARQLIAHHVASISEIAFMTGFENHSYFAARFKEEFGVLPSEFGENQIFEKRKN